MENNKNNRIEEILNSLDGSRKAIAPDFFYTRLKARMEKGIENPVKSSWVLRPVFALTILAIVVAINAIVILNSDSSKESISGNTDALQSIAAEYRLNDNSTVYDLNQDK